jgi:nucleoside-diphosphate-sugar epimerase
VSSRDTNLVTGANGFIGSHLVEYLLDRGQPVRALVRARSDRTFLDPRAEVAYGDVRRPATLVPAARGVRTVYHVAGVVATFRKRTMKEVNGIGTASLMKVCRRASPDLERFVLVSSLAAAGPSRAGRAVRESDPARPVSYYGLSKLAGERAAVTEAGAAGVTVVRPPIVYGPRDRDMLTIFRMAARGIAPTFPREKYYALVHVRDLVRGIVLAGESPRAAGRIYHVADPRACAASHLISAIADALGVRARRVPVPVGLLALFAGASDALGSGLGLPLRPLLDKTREIRADDWIADTDRAREELGFRPLENLRDGLAETVEFYREHRWL